MQKGNLPMSSIKIKYSGSDVLTSKADALVVLLEQKGWQKDELFKSLDASLNGLALKALKKIGFKAEKNAHFLLQTHTGLPFGHVLFVGLGEEAYDAAALWDLAAFIIRKARSRAISSLAIACDFSFADMPAERALNRFSLGLHGAAYRFEQYKSRNLRKDRIESCTIFGPAALKSSASAIIAQALALSDAVNFARDLVNTSSEQMTPTRLAEEAAAMAKEAGLKCIIESEAQIKKRGMNLFLAVAKGSAQEPRLITLTYAPPALDKSSKPLVLVGKGLTFDSGGLSLKQGNGMLTMKSDMAGAAAVIATMKAIAVLKPQRKIIAIVAACENMPDGRAYKLGDVITGASGLSVEIHNTDAEGRLTLADALHYGASFEPEMMMDVATLTGACVVALGELTAGYMGNDKNVTDRIEQAAAAAGEDFWPLPLNTKLKHQLKSDIADLKNVGDRYGGAILAGLFLEEFVGKTPWAHLDIAGPAFLSKSYDTHLPVGATGFGVATLLELALME